MLDKLGRVVPKPVNTNQELKVNRTRYLFVKVLFTAYVQYRKLHKKPHQKVTKMKTKFSLIMSWQNWQPDPKACLD